jgi:hypothetical protein
MKRRPGIFFLSAAVFALALLCNSPAARAYVLQTYNGSPVKWNTSSVTFYANTSGGPSYSLISIQAAMNNWSSVSSSSLRYVYGGSTTRSGVSSTDGFNTVSFGDPGDASYLGVAWYRYDSSGKMTDCDIILRVNYSWSAAYLEDIATHEFGHCVPLEHTTDPGTTMYPSVRAGARVLSQDDINGISYLYPSGTPVPALDDAGKAAFAALAAAALAFYLRRMRVACARPPASIGARRSGGVRDSV